MKKLRIQKMFETFARSCIITNYTNARRTFFLPSLIPATFTSAGWLSTLNAGRGGCCGRGDGKLSFSELGVLSDIRPNSSWAISTPLLLTDDCLKGWWLPRPSWLSMPPAAPKLAASACARRSVESLRSKSLASCSPMPSSRRRRFCKAHQVENLCNLRNKAFLHLQVYLCQWTSKCNWTRLEDWISQNSTGRSHRNLEQMRLKPWGTLTIFCYSFTKIANLRVFLVINFRPSAYHHGLNLKDDQGLILI